MVSLCADSWSACRRSTDLPHQVSSGHHPAPNGGVLHPLRGALGDHHVRMVQPVDRGGHLRPDPDRPGRRRSDQPGVCTESEIKEPGVGRGAGPRDRRRRGPARILRMIFGNAPGRSADAAPRCRRRDRSSRCADCRSTRRSGLRRSDAPWHRGTQSTSATFDPKPGSPPGSATTPTRRRKTTLTVDPARVSHFRSVAPVDLHPQPGLGDPPPLRGRCRFKPDSSQQSTVGSQCAKAAGCRVERPRLDVRGPRGRGVGEIPRSSRTACSSAGR